MRLLRTILRGTTSVLLFGVFGLGALLIAPVVLVLHRPELGQPVVRAAWRFILSVFVWTRLIRIDRGNLTDVSGMVIAASHPSLIDVVLLVSLLPRTLYVAKHGLKANPFLAAIVYATALPDDATLPEKAAPYLAKGWNVLIFPEGTRSPATGGLQTLRRGAAQLALRTGSSVACIRLMTSRRILGKRQQPWDLGDRTVTYSISSTVIPVEKAEGSVIHVEAMRLTELIRGHLAGDVSLS